MSRRWLSGAAMAAGCLLTGSPSLGQTGKAPPAYSPAPASTLVSRRDLQFRVAQTVEGETRSTVLAHQRPDGQLTPVAIIRTSGSPGHVQASVQRLSLPATPDDASVLEVATLEQLYVVLMRQDPEARSCLSREPVRCDPAKDGQSHPELLRQVVQARQHVLRRAPGAGSSVPWQVVTMAPPASRGPDPDDVAVRVTNDRQPISGTSIFFNRAPHSSCVGRTGADGVAACRLVDQHGDEAQHDDQDRAAVVATFPGDVRAERVLLPTTFVLPGTP